METMEKTITEIKLAYPDANDLHLWLKFGACRLSLKAGGSDLWVKGTFDEAESGIKPEIRQEGGTATITQEWGGLRFPGLFSGPPEFKLEAGKSKPFKLSLDGGAGESALELGGLPIQRLVLSHGAGRMWLNFAEPNLVPMSLIRITSGASDMVIRGLANANCAELSLEGGASRNVLGFEGELKQDLHAQIKVGAAAVELWIPRATPTKIVHESFLGGVDMPDGFTRKDGAYQNPAALEGKTPLLTIHANLALGSLKVLNL